MPKAIAICASRHAAGSTEHLLKRCLERLEREGFESRLVSLLWKKVFPCLHCSGCAIVRNGSCSVEGDDFAVLYKDLLSADIIVIGAPVDLGVAPSDLKHFLERSINVARACGNPLSRKVGTAVPVLGREASKHSLRRLLDWFPAMGLVVPGATAYPAPKGVVSLAIKANDEGEAVMDELASTLAWLARKVR